MLREFHRNQIKLKEGPKDTMAEARYDILFAGELAGEADPVDVRRQLQQKFKLSDEATERLFGGGAIAVRRDVDLATAERYQDIFRVAGALARIRKVESSPELPPASLAVSAETSVDVGETGETGPAADPTALRPESEAQVGELAEDQDAVGATNIDISNLSLVEGKDWTLEDCQPPLEHMELPDISHLELVEIASEDDEVPES